MWLGWLCVVECVAAMQIPHSKAKSPEGQIAAVRIAAHFLLAMHFGGALVIAITMISFLGRLPVHGLRLPSVRRLSAEIPKIPHRSHAAASSLLQAQPGTVLGALEDWRQRTAKGLDIPAEKILSDQILQDLATHKPTSLEELWQHPDITPPKIEFFGWPVLQVIKSYAEGGAQEQAAAPLPPKSVGIEMQASPRALTNQTPMEPSAVTQSAQQAEGHDLLPGPAFHRLWRILPFDEPVEKTKPRTRAKRADKTEKAEKAPPKPKRASRGLKGIQTMTKEEKAALMVPVINKEDLNDEQLLAAEKILSGHNVFVTGSAGTGKTFLLRYVIQELNKAHGDEAIAITAPTGIAAISIGGQTVHSFAGIGLGEGGFHKVLAKVKANKLAMDRWKKSKVLVIDEISMLDKGLFELLDQIAKTIRVNQRPFGGLQLIVVGDFLQLPPVTKNDAKFAFQSHVWDLAGLNREQGKVYLRKVERQSDQEFIDHLNEVRIGIYTPAFMTKLSACLVDRKPKPTDGIVPTKLYAVNKQVDDENRVRLEELPGQVIKMQAVDKWAEPPDSDHPSDAKHLQEGVRAMIPDTIELKVGAQVMLLRNQRQKPGAGASSLVNGSRGKILSFIQTEGAQPRPYVQFDNGQCLAVSPVEFEYGIPSMKGTIIRSQIPLKLAWAATVHKSQGCTLTCAELMMDKAFDFGQVYVALSRVKNVQGLWLSTPILPKHVKANPEVLAFYGHTKSA